jgi:hypothetical protein
MSGALSMRGEHLRTAIIFRTHFWDDFARRQFDRLRARVVHGDVFVLVDETNGPAGHIAHDGVVRMTEADVLRLGLARRGEQNLMWFNGDYPLYYFLSLYQNYDYYLQVEYDVVMNTDLDRLVARAAADATDFVGLTKGEPVEAWAWRQTCVDAYDAKDIRYQLICCCLLSHRALELLFARRLELSNRLINDEAWPFCEGFIATEIRLAGMKSVELSDYLDTTAYNTWPPYIESELPALAQAPVIHPVLDQPRYVASLLKYKVGVAGYLNPLSLFHRKLRRLSVRDYLGALGTSFAFKARRTLRNRGLIRT